MLAYVMRQIVHSSSANLHMLVTNVDWARKMQTQPRTTSNSSCRAGLILSGA